MKKQYRSFGLHLLSRLIFAAVLLAVLAANMARPAAARPRFDNGYDVIALVNQLRAANGLPAYEINAALMAAAKSHSDYQAETGNTSHTGPGGSTPKSRAIAFGYGGGATVFVSENIASGTQMSAAFAVQMWQGDSLHLNTMLSPNYTDAGAGVSSSGGITYITLDVGYIAGSAGSAPSQPVATAVPGAAATSASGGSLMAYVVTVTPQPDGSIIHTVKSGEVLINIALAYGVKLSELYSLNNYNDKTVIYPGEKVKIKGSDPTPTPTLTPTNTHQPTSTPRPTRTPAPSPSPGTQVTESPLATQTTPYSSPGADPLLITIGLLAIVGAALVLGGTVLKKKG